MIMRNGMVLFVGVILAVGVVRAADTERGILVRAATLRITPDTSSAKIAECTRGRELVVIERSHDWVKVFAEVDKESQITGWTEDKGIVRTTTPKGDAILFGEAEDSEDQASRPHGRHGAAQDAMRIYARLAEYFPNSPLAAEALYRSADIRWQIEYADVMTLPSAKEQDPDVRQHINEEYMRAVIKKFPHTKWADMAAYHLLDNKVCGDWQGQARCPERETELYEKYAREHPRSPSAPEALYKAAQRQAALIEIYKTDNQPGKSSAAERDALALAQRVTNEFPQSEWSRRAAALAYEVLQHIPTYGNATD